MGVWSSPGKREAAADGDELASLREAIDDVDARLVELVAARLELARRIGLLKARRGMDVVDPSRERGVLRRALDRAGSRVPPAALLALLEPLIDAARSVQGAPRIAHLGPSGTHSEAAARSFFPDASLVPTASLPEAVRAVGDTAELAVVPWWNRVAGPVLEVHDALRDVGPHVQPLRWAKVPVQHVFAARPGARPRTLLARPEPLACSREWLDAHYSALQIEHVSSNGAAAREAALREDAAAITTAAAAKIHGLEVLAEGIDGDSNTTTFVVLGRG